ncbi:MAG: hypothetical protein QOD52_2698 [Gaiellaceae bacterium]|jgi:hypothetical protein|nr:hypothetical protein [Gaiellaceae bacterium]
MKMWMSIVAAVGILLVAAVPAVGAANPSGTGQPSQSCQAEPTGPPGLISTTNGFASVAVNVYAGSPGTPSLANGDAHAVSQYDVACFQVSQH